MAHKLQKIRFFANMKQIPCLVTSSDGLPSEYVSFRYSFFFHVFCLEVTYLNMQIFICWVPFRSNVVLFPGTGSLATHITPSRNTLTFQEAQTSKQSLKIITPPQDLIHFDSLSSYQFPSHFMAAFIIHCSASLWLAQLQMATHWAFWVQIWNLRCW